MRSIFGTTDVSARFLSMIQGPEHRGGVVPDHRQVGSHRRIRLGAALFEGAEDPDRKAEAGRELGLRETEP